MADRNIVHYIEAEDQNVDAVPEQGYFTRLIDIIITNLEEYASNNNADKDFDPNRYNTSSSSPNDQSDVPPKNEYTQLGGIDNIKDAAKKKEFQNMRTELQKAKSSILTEKNRFLTADDANVIIKYIEYLMNAIVGAKSMVQDVQCQYPRDTTIFPLAAPTILAGKDQIVFTDADVSANMATNTISIPNTVNVVYVTGIGNEDCAITVTDPSGGAHGVTWFDSDAPGDEDGKGTYVYVDAGAEYSLTLAAKDGRPIVGRGVNITWSQDINYGHVPTVADSDENSGVISLAAGSKTVAIPSNGTTTVSISPVQNCVRMKIHYEGEHLNMYTTIDDQRVNIVSNYDGDFPAVILPGITELPVYESVMAVRYGDTYQIVIEGDAGEDVVFSWSAEVNFEPYDVVLGSDYAAEEAQVCSNTDISCPNRVLMNGYKDEYFKDSPGYVYVCSNPVRQEVVSIPDSSAFSISRVSKDQIVYASKWTLNSQYLRQISQKLDEEAGNYDPNGYCGLTCQVRCQSSCELACQHCYGGTCHDQACGSW